jgi:hypothetical protein
MGSIELISSAVSLLQGIVALTDAYSKVSIIVAKRIAEGREQWTPEEEKAILDALASARADAVSSVEQL